MKSQRGKWKHPPSVDNEYSTTTATDGLVSGQFENGGLLGKGKGPRNRRASDAIKNSSLVEAQMQFLELRNQRTLTRQQTIEEERIDQVEGVISYNSFRNHNKTFHKIFPDIPDEDDLTHAFTCALQKEVLYHGKLYVSHQYIGFYSTVLLKATKVIIEVADVHTVKKKNTAKVVPNALSVITNSGEKYVFVSLRNRDACYQLLLTVCPHIEVDSGMSPPGTQSSLDPELDIISGNSSQDESVSRRTSMDEPLPLAPTYVDMPKSSLESPRTSSSQRSSSKDGYSTEDGDTGTNDSAAGGSWMSFGWEKVQSFLLEREFHNTDTLFVIYILLLVLLLLTSGYIGLRIVALEEQLSALSSLHEEYKET